jgi:hypothetical protein
MGNALKFGVPAVGTYKSSGMMAMNNQYNVHGGLGGQTNPLQLGKPVMFGAKNTSVRTANNNINNSSNLGMVQKLPAALNVETKIVTQVLPTTTTSVFGDFQCADFFVTSKCARMKGLQELPVFCATSALTVSEEADKVFETVLQLIKSMQHDIDIIDSDQESFFYRASVFIDHQSIDFSLNLFSCNNNNTKIELQRMSGDVITFEKFWNEMKKEISSNLSVLNNSESDTEENSNNNALSDVSELSFASFDSFEFAGMSSSYDSSDLDFFADDILANDSSSYDTLSIVIQEIENNSEFGDQVLKHDKLLNAIIVCLQHPNVAMIRTAVVILKTISFNDVNVFKPLLEHSSQLIVRLVSEIIQKTV